MGPLAGPHLTADWMAGSIQELSVLVNDSEVHEARAALVFAGVIHPEIPQVDAHAGHRPRQLVAARLRAGALEAFGQRARRDIALQAGEREHGTGEFRTVVALVVLDHADVALGRQRHDLRENLALREVAEV